MKVPIPKALEKRLAPYKERGDEILRSWEWTWTSAWVAGIVILFVAITTLAVVPSWWLFFSDGTLEWRTRIQITIRDLVVLGWLNVWGAIFVIAAYKIQVYRKKLRGESQAERYSGGYR